MMILKGKGQTRQKQKEKKQIRPSETVEVDKSDLYDDVISEKDKSEDETFIQGTSIKKVSIAGKVDVREIKNEKS